MAAPLAYTTTGAKLTGQLRIQAVVWTGATAAGDTCILKDAAGTVFFPGRTDLTNTFLGMTFPGNDGRGLEVTGLTVDTLSAGTVYVYVSTQAGEAL